MIFTNKYQPKTEMDIVGQDLALKKIKAFLKNFSDKALLLYGPVGTGKTSAVYALANDLNLEVFELNASDQRNKEQIETLVKNATTQLSLFKKGKIILIEEIDGISGRQDRGAIPSLIKILEQTKYPIIFTTNNLELDKIQPLMKKVNLVKFFPLDRHVMINVLEKICKKEKITYQIKDLEILCKNQDLRAAINDLQCSIINNKLQVSEMRRDQKDNMQKVLTMIFKGNDAKLSYDILDNLNQDLIDYSTTRSPAVFGNDDAYTYWVEENIPNEYYGEDLVNAFNMMSKADIFRGRILRRQYWRFLVYLRTLLSSGITLSKSRENKMPVDYKKTKRSPKQNRKLWFLVNKRKRIISEKIAEKTHKSVNYVKTEIPYYKFILKKYPLSEFGFSEEERDYLLR